MLCLKKPTIEEMSDFLLSQKDAPFSYTMVKGTADYSTKDQFLADERFKLYDVDHLRAKIGQGEAHFQKAVEGFRAWKQFNMEWVELYHPDTPIAVGSEVAIVAKSFAVWTASACRITYVIDEDTPSFRKFGFAYGTLGTHVERGEERFTLEWNKTSNDIIFDILAFSQPQSWFTKVAYPVARYFQNFFSQSSVQAMKEWLANGVDQGKQEVQIV